MTYKTFGDVPIGGNRRGKAHRDGPKTMQDAADIVEARTGAMRERIFSMIASSDGFGLITDEVEIVTGETHQSASARVNELMNLRVITTTDDANGDPRTRLTRKHCPAQIWHPVTDGRPYTVVTKGVTKKTMRRALRAALESLNYYAGMHGAKSDWTYDEWIDHVAAVVKRMKDEETP